VRVNDTIVIISVIATTAAAGLCVANILRKKDNLVKLVGASASIVTIIAAQCMLFPSLREKTFTVQTVIGAGIISISTWMYNYFKQKHTAPDHAAEARLEFSESEDIEFDEHGETHDKMPAIDEKANNAIAPTRNRLLTCIAVIAFLAFIATQYRAALAARLSPASQQISDLDPEKIPKLTPVNDLDRYFVPHNITPTAWGTTNTSYLCIEDWSTKEAKPLSSNFQNWEEAFAHSGCPVYPIPEGGFIFHQYWKGPWRLFNEVSIEAFLATQRLGDGHRLIYWYEDGGPTEDVRTRFTEGKYGKYIEFREFNATEEAEGYCVENMPEWNNIDYIQANGMELASLSDIIRVFLLAKYGGIWLDADTIPLRDFTPMIRAGPSAVAVSSSP
jgi:hypothetical protein